MVCLDTPNSRPISAAVRPASSCFSAPIISTSEYFRLDMPPPLGKMRKSYALLRRFRGEGQYRDGTLAECVAVEARNLTPLPGDVDFTVGAALVMPGMTAWQGLFEHGRLHAGQSVLVHGAAGVVGSMASQLARESGAYVSGTERSNGRQTALDFGAQEFVDLDNDALEDVGGV